MRLPNNGLKLTKPSIMKLRSLTQCSTHRLESDVTDTGLAPLVIIVLPLLIFAIVAARQQIRAHRWDPAFFREGIAAYRRGVELPRSLSHVSLPSELEQQLALQMRVRRLSAHELAFFAPVLNGSLMRGLLRYDPEACSLEVVGYLQWGLWALMSTLAFVAATGGWRCRSHSVGVLW